MSRNPPRDRCNTGYRIGDVVHVEPTPHPLCLARGGRIGIVVGFGNPDYNPRGVRILFRESSQPYTIDSLRLDPDAFMTRRTVHELTIARDRYIRKLRANWHKYRVRYL